MVIMKWKTLAIISTTILVLWIALTAWALIDDYQLEKKTNNCWM